MRLFLALCTLLVCFSSSAQLASGPMIGHTDLRTVYVWMQTEVETTVHLEFWPIAHKDSVMTSEPVLAQNAHARTATLIATGLEPGRTYAFAVIEGTGTRNEGANFQFTTSHCGNTELTRLSSPLPAEVAHTPTTPSMIVLERDTEIKIKFSKPSQACILT